MESFTISQLAAKAKIPISTLRYYERIELLVPEERTTSNYRRYGRSSLHKLKFIAEIQRLGLTLSDARAMMGASCGKVQVILSARLEQLEAEMKELSRTKRQLRNALKFCGASEKSGVCSKMDF